MIGMAVSRIATRIERRQQLRTKIDVFLSGSGGLGRGRVFGNHLRSGEHVHYRTDGRSLSGGLRIFPLHL